MGSVCGKILTGWTRSIWRKPLRPPKHHDDWTGDKQVFLPKICVIPFFAPRHRHHCFSCFAVLPKLPSRFPFTLNKKRNLCYCCLRIFSSGNQIECSNYVIIAYYNRIPSLDTIVQPKFKRQRERRFLVISTTATAKGASPSSSVSMTRHCS